MLSLKYVLRQERITRESIISIDRNIISIDRNQLVKTVSQMNNSKVEQLLIPQGNGKAVLCTVLLGIRCSQDATTLLRQTFKTDENAVIIQLDAIEPLQNTKVIIESRVFKDITNCVNIAQEHAALSKKDTSMGSFQEDLSIEHVHASRTAPTVHTGVARSATMRIGYAGPARNIPMVRSNRPKRGRRSAQLPNKLLDLHNAIRSGTPLGTSLIANRMERLDIVTQQKGEQL